MPVPTIAFQQEEKLKFSLPKKPTIKKWLPAVIRHEKSRCGKLSYFFCSDKFLLTLNKKFLEHDTYTDIITFDYSVGDEISGEIFISIDRVKENAGKFKESFEHELLRVMAHGVLHLCGYGDKSAAEKKIMRRKEQEAVNMFYK